MIIYHHEKMILERMEKAKELLDQIPAKYCFITGSFLYKQDYNDIDIFVVSRTKKKMKIENKKVKITVIDFNDLYSLFYHSVSKSCIAKNILPMKELKVTLADYWHVINEAIPTILNRKDKYHKDIRFLILYTEYFKTGEVLDTYQLSKKIASFRKYEDILDYVKENVPEIMLNKGKKSYLKRFFYTQAGFYKDIHYDAQKFLYGLTHAVTRGLANG